MKRGRRLSRVAGELGIGEVWEMLLKKNDGGGVPWQYCPEKTRLLWLGMARIRPNVVGFTWEQLTAAQRFQLIWVLLLSIEVFIDIGLTMLAMQEQER